jgi:hypothetical protein
MERIPWKTGLGGANHEKAHQKGPESRSLESRSLESR